MTSDRVALNFSIRRDTHQRLRAIMAEIDAVALQVGELGEDGEVKDRCETWEQLMDYVAKRTIEVAFDMVDIDGQEPRFHTATFRLGDQLFKWDGKRSVCIYDSTRHEKTVRALISLGGGLNPGDRK